MQPTPQSDAGFLIQAKHTDHKCLHVAGNSTCDGVAIVQWDCMFDPAAQPPVQRWRKQESSSNPNEFRLISQFSGKCLDLAFASKDRAAAVVQRTCNGSPSQLWTKIFQTSDGSSELQNVGSTFVLRVSNGSTERSAAIIQWDSNPTLLYQRFTLVP
jgi:hypothetical protein